MPLTQTQTCPDRPTGDSTNAAANTRFVRTAVLNGIVTSVGSATGDILVGGTSGGGLKQTGQVLSEFDTPIFTPEQFGAVADGVTDCSTPFTLLNAAITAAGKGRIEFARNGTYVISPAGSPTSFGAINNTNGVTINFNGSTIDVPYSFAAAIVIFSPLFFLNSTNIIINDPKFTQSNHVLRGSDRGIIGIYVGTAVFNIVVNNFQMNGGNIGFDCDRNAGELKAAGITINSARFNEVFYPLAFQKNGDAVTANAIVTFHPGRSYFAVNVSNHRVQLLSDANDLFNDIVIANAYHTPDTTQQSNVTNDIYVQYTNRVNPAGVAGIGVASYADIQFSNDGTGEGYQYIGNITLCLDVVRTPDDDIGPLLKITNTNSTAQARDLENIYITGTLRSNFAGSTAFMQLMVDKDWTGDNVRNLVLENLTCFTAGGAGTVPLQIDGRGITGPFTMRNVFGVNSACTFAPTNMGGTTAAFPFLHYENVWLPTAITPGTLPVANLPTCTAGIEGTGYFVSDANATTFHSVVAGGGANHVAVRCLNTNWVIGG